MDYRFTVLTLKNIGIQRKFTELPVFMKRLLIAPMHPRKMNAE
jgi:hypothetical protein